MIAPRIRVWWYLLYTAARSSPTPCVSVPLGACLISRDTAPFLPPRFLLSLVISSFFPVSFFHRTHFVLPHSASNEVLLNTPTDSRTERLGAEHAELEIARCARAVVSATIPAPFENFVYLGAGTGRGRLWTRNRSSVIGPWIENLALYPRASNATTSG